MRSKRVFQGLMVGALAATLIAAGCKKEQDESADKDESGEKSEAKDGDKSSAKSAATMPPAVSYGMFPADSEMLFGVAFEPVRNSALWKKYRDAVVANVDTDGELKDFQDACGFDPFTKIESVMFGGSTADDDRMVVVVHGFSRDEIKSCGEGVAKAEDEEFSVTDEGNLSQYTVGGDELWVAWLDDNTLLTGPRGETDKEWIEKRAKAEEGLAADSALADLVENQVDRGSGLWFGMIPADDSPVGGGMAMAGGPQPQAIYGSVAPTDGLAISAGLRFESEDDAKKVLDQSKQMLQMVKLQAGELGKFVDKTEMSTKESDMLVNLALSEQELTELVEGVGAMFGGMMGGMGGGAPH